MARRHYNFPSLNALAAFEAAGRHMSLTRGAAELNVTPGAMSKQVTQLEKDIGTRLFVRRHRALDLTPEGAALLAVMKDSFERIAATLEGFGRRKRVRSVSIATTSAFAQFWLMPRLGPFWSAHQDIVIDHVISDRTQDSWGSHVDLRVRYGNGAFPDEEAVKLFDDTILAVAAPSWLSGKGITQMEDVASQPLLSVEGVDWSWTTWSEFLHQAGVRGRRPNIRRFNSYVIAVQAALDGQGTVLGWKALLRNLLADGRLQAVGGFEMPAPHAFYLTWSVKRPLSSEAATLRDWLVQSLA